jgi:hypothetical protein
MVFMLRWFRKTTMYLQEAIKLAKDNNYVFDKFFPPWSLKTDKACKQVLDELDLSNLEGSPLEIYIVIHYAFWLAMSDEAIVFPDLYTYSVYSSISKLSLTSLTKETRWHPSQKRGIGSSYEIKTSFESSTDALYHHLFSIEVNKYGVYLANSKYYHVVNLAIEELIEKQPDWLFTHVVINESFVVYNPIGSHLINYLSSKMSLLASSRFSKLTGELMIKYEISVNRWPDFLESLEVKYKSREIEFLRHIRLLPGTNLYRCMVDHVGMYVTKFHGTYFNSFVYIEYVDTYVDRLRKFISENHIIAKPMSVIEIGSDASFADDIDIINLHHFHNEDRMREAYALAITTRTAVPSYGYNKTLRWPYFHVIADTLAKPKVDASLIESILKSVEMINPRYLQIDHLPCSVCFETEVQLIKCAMCNQNFCKKCVSAWEETNSELFFNRCMSCGRIVEVRHSKLPMLELRYFMLRKMIHFNSIVDDEVSYDLTDEIHANCATDEGTQICKCGATISKMSGCNHLVCIICKREMVFKPTICDRSIMSHWNIESIRDVAYIREMVLQIKTIDEFIHDYKIYFMDTSSSMNFRNVMNSLIQTELVEYDPTTL